MKRLFVLLAVGLLATSCSDSPATTTTVTTTETTSTTAAVTTTPETTTVAPGPEDLASEEVSFPAQDIDLVGTLRLPAGDDYPAVVLIHGSGPNSRDETLPGQLNMTFGFEIPVFAEIGDALQAAGFAVLTYDKRTCGAFSGCADNEYPIPGDDIVIDDFIADATAAVDYLRQRPDIDPDRISVVGHSQGAEFVPVLLAADPVLSSGVMLAGPYRPIDQIIEFQFDSTIDLFESLGLTAEQAVGAPGVDQVQETIEGLKAIRAGSDEPVGGASAAFWQSWFDLGQARIAAVAELTQPVLILGGVYDWNVPPEDAAAWDDLFTEAGAEHETVILECITHALNCVTEIDPNAVTPDDIGEHVADEVIDALVAFLAG